MMGCSPPVSGLGLHTHYHFLGCSTVYVPWPWFAIPTWIDIVSTELEFLESIHFLECIVILFLLEVRYYVSIDLLNFSL